MPSLARVRRIRWAAPVVVMAVIGMVAFVPTLSAAATPSLAPVTPQQLLVKVQQANVEALSGTIDLTANLGLPNLSSLSDLTGQGSGFNPTDLLSGSHQARIWVDGPDRQRIALPSSLAETDVIHNGTNVWIWQSSGSKVEHLQRAGGTGAGGQASSTTGTPTAETPAQLADSLLARVDASTAVSVGTPTYVAKHAVYVLDIAPRSVDSTIDHVAIAVDSTTGLPLKVSIFAKGQAKAALALGFSSIKFARPAASTFDFTPPPGATVTNGLSGGAIGLKGPRLHSRTAGSTAGNGARVARPAQPAGAIATGGTKVVGSDWTQVAIVTTTGGLPPEADLVLKAATPVSGAWGSGRLLQTALVNVLVLDGRIAVGAVSPAALESAVASAH